MTSDATYIEIKPGKDLTSQEEEQVNIAKAREWKTPPMSEEHKGLCIFVLLKNSDGQIVAQGQLIPIDGVEFDGKYFTIYGIGGIIANQKGQGYGRKLMEAVRNYLVKNNLTGIGFTGDETIKFYRKCGFQSDKPSLQRFVHVDGDLRNKNTNDDWVFYLDPTDQLMSAVLASPAKEIFLPRDPDW